MRPEEFVHITGANEDDDHPFGDLDRIDCDVSIMPLRAATSRKLYGYDIAFLAEAVAERDGAMANRDTSQKLSRKFDRRLLASAASATSDVWSLRIIYDYIRNMAAVIDTQSDCWFTSRPSTSSLPKVVEYPSIASTFDNVLRKGSPLIPEITDWTNLKLLKSRISSLFFDNLNTFGNYYSWPHSGAMLNARAEDFDYVGEIEITPSPLTLYKREFYEERYPGETDEEDVVETGEASVKSSAQWTPGARSDYWSQGTSSVVAFVRVDESGWTSDELPHSKTVYIAVPIGAYFELRTNRIPQFLRTWALGGNLLRLADVTPWAAGSAPTPEDGTTQASQTIEISLVSVVPILKLRNHTVWE